MKDRVKSQRVFLLLDTCGERASVAVARADGEALAQVVLGSRAASTEMMEAIRSALAVAGLMLIELDGIGVVSGPGSFTGMRVGLATAKGLCEAAQLPMAAVSRLEVLAEAGAAGAVCALQAGRGQVYVRALREGVVTESLVRDENVSGLLGGAGLVVESGALAVRLADRGAVQQVELTALHALGPVLRRFEDGGSDVGLTEANYVRDEGAIYRKPDLAKVLVE